MATEPDLPFGPSSGAAAIAVLEAEDRRPAGGADLAVLVAGLEADDPGVRRLAVRALGRLERPDLAASITAALDDPEPAVRAQAADALAQATRAARTTASRDALRRHMATEDDPEVLGALAASLGRLATPEPGVSQTALEAAILQAGVHEAPVARLGAARGLEAVARRAGSGYRPAEATLAWLETALQEGRAPGADAAIAPRIRRLAAAARVRAGALDAAGARLGLTDEDPEVRRLATSALARHAEDGADLLQRALDDPEARVRLEALAGVGALLREGAAGPGCEAVRARVDDPSPHVRLRAIALLGGACGHDPRSAPILAALADSLPGGEEIRANRGWHGPARALVALAAAAPEQALVRLPGFAAHPTWQVRMYAARAAALLPGDLAPEPGATTGREILEGLAADDTSNVRSEALGALAGRAGGDATGLMVAALESDDHQLLLTAARALRDPPRPGAVGALLAALQRLTATGHETSRDPRMALLDALAASGGPEQAPYLEPLLDDLDPEVASRVAEILGAWTGEPREPTPTPPAPAPFPDLDELRELAGARVIVEMEAGGAFELRLLPFEAPTNVARFARLARQGAFDGLTFHRVVANFVIQGGSPGANEYVGHGHFTRDEVGRRSHLRGTVGISTRGRDTGDGQIFVNLVDNVRLDHDYTIIAETVQGMEVVDGVLEGDVIARVRIEGT